MRVSVTFFAPFRYQIGVSHCDLCFGEESLTVHEFLGQVRRRWPKLSHGLGGGRAEDQLRGLTLIVNGEVKDAAFALRDGDRVNILGPLSGG
jgi:molybdopterin converting factor small subunit